jgi:hypothetical protein
MRNAGRSTCRACGKHKRDVGTISHGGYCSICGPMVLLQANHDLHHHKGYYFNRWRRACAASVGAVLLDDLQPRE